MADSSSNKRIAKNTAFLYTRMLVTFAVNLFTVRVIWQVLGVDNYGIYTLVGGIVLMFQFLNSAMISASQRFIAFELGRENVEQVKKVFSNILTVHLFLAAIVLVVGETLGLWFINTQLSIPPDRWVAANWVYQCSILSFIVTIISVPYNSSIVAHEHMKAYGYFGILDVILKLAIVFALIFIPWDKLIVYALLHLGVIVVMRVVYGIYCKRNFEECEYHYTHEKSVIGQIFAFAGWSLLGNLGFSIRSQGLNIVINLFFNVAVNAAKGIANQVSTAIYGFTSNFQMALNPQIIKRYASGEIKSMMELVFNGSKYSFFLLMLVNIPLYIACEEVLKLWLGDLAPYTVGFTRLILIMLLIDSLAGPLVTSMQAVGKIKTFQIVISIIMTSTIAIAWVWLLLDRNPYIVMYAAIITSVAGLIARLILLNGMIHFSYTEYFVRIIGRILLCVIPSYLILVVLYPLFPANFWGVCVFGIISVFINGVLVLLLGLQKSEKSKVWGLLKKFVP